MRPKRAFLFYPAIFLIFFLAACSTPDGPVLSDGNTFDPGVMEAKIRAYYQGRVVGFAYAINHDQLLARSGAWGMARRSIDGGQPMTVQTRFQVASVSKAVNAIYFFSVLRRVQTKKGPDYVGLDSPVSPWLPPSWIQGPGFMGPNGVTFRQLLAHTSGLRQIWDGLDKDARKPWGNDWDGLKYVVSLGAKPGFPRAYKNANSALFRILIPRLLRVSGVGSLVEITKDTAGPAYVAYLNQYLFAPLGIAWVDCQVRRDGNYAMFYDYDGPRLAGFFSGWGEQDCGGHAGLQLSVMELAKLLAYVRYTDLILDDAGRQAMSGQALGWFNRKNVGTPETAKLLKAGDWYNYYIDKDTQPSAVAAIHACVMQYPRKVEAVLLINSTIAGGAPRPCDGLDQAYEAAVAGP